MLKLLFNDAIKTPGKLLALCFVVYMATVSFFVAGFIFLLGARWLHKQMVLKAKALDAADVEASKVEAAKATAAAAAAANPVAVAATVAPASGNASNDATGPAIGPTRQYAKSTVVLPFKTASR